jgi:hypothetical protein
VRPGSMLDARLEHAVDATAAAAADGTLLVEGTAARVGLVRWAPAPAPR